MHSCPICDESCFCDMDDTGGLDVPDDCPHVCDEFREDDEAPSEHGGGEGEGT